QKSGTAVTTFAVPFVNSGSVNITGGSLIFNGGFTNSGGSFGGNGATIQSTTALDLGAGTLAGNSVITAPNVSTSGIVAPGNSAGLVTVNGNLTLLAGSKLIMELGGTQQGISYDALVVSGTVILGAQLQVSFYD